MNPLKAKTLIAVLIVVVVISLMMNLILFGRLHRTNKQAEKWEKKAYEQIAIRQSLLEKKKESQKLFQAEKQRYSSKTNRTLQSTKVFKLPKRSTQSGAESGEYWEEDVEENNDFFREEIRDMLTEALMEEFPELDLNEAEIAELTNVVITIRQSMEDLHSMVRSSDTVEAIKELQQQRDLAMLDFERITGVSVMEFMLHAPGEGGIDHD